MDLFLYLAGFCMLVSARDRGVRFAGCLIAAAGVADLNWSMQEGRVAGWVAIALLALGAVIVILNRKGRGQ